MKKVSTVAAKPSKKISQQKLTVGLDLPTCTERNESLLESADGSMATVATRQNESSSYEKPERIHLTPTSLLMEGDYTH
jgi:hypothetical protein